MDKGGGRRRPPSEGSAPLLIDWSGSFNPAGATGPNVGIPTKLPSARPWIRPFLLELATDTAADPNRDIRIELPDVAEVLPALAEPLLPTGLRG
jgi:hypothetical protein